MGVSLLRFNEHKHEKEDILEGPEELQPLLQNGVPILQVCCPEQSAEPLTVFWNDVARQLLREFTVYDPKRKDRRQVDGTIMKFSKPDIWVHYVVCC